MGTRLLVVYWVCTGGPTRIGIAAARRLGSQVARNRARRRVREIVRRQAAELAEGFDVVVLARGGAAEAPFDELERSLARLWSEAGLRKGC